MENAVLGSRLMWNEATKTLMSYWNSVQLVVEITGDSVARYTLGQVFTSALLDIAKTQARQF